MRASRAWPLLLLLSVAPAFAAGAPQDDPPARPDAAASPLEQRIKEVQEAFDKAQQEFYAAYRAAADEAERKKVLETKRPDPAAFVARMWEAVAGSEAEPAAAAALTWIVERSEGADKERGLATLLEKHLQSDALSGACQSLAYGRHPAEERFLRQVRESSPHAAVKAQATYVLGVRMKRSSETLQRLLDLERKSDEETARKSAESLAQSLGEEAVAALRARGVPGLLGEAEALLEEVVASAGEIKSWRGTLADQAKGDLFELRNLAVGKAAPEIEGKDSDGVAFKLSDYKGKVVMLDFWGNW